MKKRVEFVNPFIGTAGSGHALVGPLHPHGMVKLGPDTISLPCGGYDYTDGKILGFSHTHLEGVGGSGGRGNMRTNPPGWDITRGVCWIMISTWSFLLQNIAASIGIPSPRQRTPIFL